jgi:adenylate cyclase
MDYTAIGDTVNLASRLCGLAGPEEIFVSGEVAKRTKELYPARSEGSLSIKGKKEEVPVYRIPYSLSA